MSVYRDYVWKVRYVECNVKPTDVNIVMLFTQTLAQPSLTG